MYVIVWSRSQRRSWGAAPPKTGVASRSFRSCPNSLFARSLDAFGSCLGNNLCGLCVARLFLARSLNAFCDVNKKNQTLHTCTSPTTASPKNCIVDLIALYILQNLEKRYFAKSAIGKVALGPYLSPLPPTSPLAAARLYSQC